MEEKKVDAKATEDAAPEEGAFYMVGPFQPGTVRFVSGALILGVSGVWACAFCLYEAVLVLERIQLLLGK